MEFGIFMGPTDYSIRVEKLAVAVEEAGLESYWVPEHSHIPVKRITPSPDGRKELPRGYKSGLSPWVALAAAAAVTTRIKLATGCALVTEHHPINLAKEVATLDVISEGRAIFGIATGWNIEELANHGIDPADRWDVMAERTKAIQAIWTNEEAEFHGRFVDFDPIWQWPKPVQLPGPPILVGGNGRRAMRHAVAYGDGWMPTATLGLGDITDRVRELAELCAAAKRPQLPITVFGLGADAAAVETYLVDGVDRIVFRIGPGPETEVMGQLEIIADLVASFS
jgi:probable F420-dependent oxidoreductase